MQGLSLAVIVCDCVCVCVCVCVRACLAQVLQHAQEMELVLMQGLTFADVCV